MKQEKIKNWIKETLELKAEPVLVHPKDIKNGDYTFISSSQNPDEEFKKLLENKLEIIDRVESMGRFINFHLSRKFFSDSVAEILKQGENWGKNAELAGEKVMVEYTDPNPFKPFHIGHLMTNAIGESIARIFENSGATVSRANYQGDVGLHVAKAMYALFDDPKTYLVRNESIADQANFIGVAYAKGSSAYENHQKAKAEIDAINKKIYDRSDEKINEIYDWGFKVTMEAFEDLYRILGTQFEFYFLESQMAPIGVNIVKENTGKVFHESDGAIVFKGEEHDAKLHTRVFITSQGLPTYETKELGLTVEKFKTLPYMELSLVVTANEQEEYMKVVGKALSLIHPEYEDKMKHITHGMMRLSSGKMSSRKGNIVTGESLLRDSVELVKEKMEAREFLQEEKIKISEIVGVAALKYSILRSSAGSDIIYDTEKSLSFEGDSGPYLQYSAIRAKSILVKAENENISHSGEHFPNEINNLEKILYRFPEVALRAYTELEPHHIATYLTELASNFNSFYAQTQIINKADKNSAYYLDLTTAFFFTIKNGLHLLGIQVPEKM